MSRPRRQIELPGAKETRDRLLAEQGGVCAICGNPPKTRRLSIDHDHKTGATRGLLCFRCNRALPTYVDGVWLHEAARYLIRFETRDTLPSLIRRGIVPE